MKVAVITGASGNLGQALVKKFLESGYRVIGTTIPNDPVKLDIKDPLFETHLANLADEKSAGDFIEKVVTRYQKIDAVVLTVGGFAMGNIEKTSLADIRAQFCLNVETAYNIARPLFLNMMKNGSGRIFLVGSRPGSDMQHSKGMVAYGLAKSMLFRLAEMMNLEAKGKNVVTAVIVPSTIDTTQNRKSMPEANPADWVKPEAIADVILFYCSEQAAIIREPVIKVYNNA